MTSSIKYSIGNIVKWNKQYWIVSNDDGNMVELIPFNISNSKSYPSDKWPTPETGRIAIDYISDTMYGWLIKNLIKGFEIEESLSATGWTPK